MALTLCPREEDGWKFDLEEDLILTPSPRQVDWSELPDECIKHILLMLDYVNLAYWNEITEQKKYDLFRAGHTGLISKEQVPMVEFHMNKRKIIRGLTFYQETWDALTPLGIFRARDHRPDTSDDVRRSLASDSPYKVKVIKRKKKGKTSCRCSLCGKVGHNKNNSKFH